MKTLTLVLVALSSSSVFAKHKPCEYRLAPAPEVHLTRVSFAEGLASTSDFDRHLIADWVELHGLDVVEDGKGILTAVAFDNRDGQKDRVMMLEGRIEADQFVVEKVLDEKKNYNHFKRLAQARNQKPVEYTVGRRIMKCPSIVVEGSTQIKIAMKHGLDLDDVMDFLARTRSSPVLMEDRSHRRFDGAGYGKHGRTRDRGQTHGHGRYEIAGYDDDGRFIKAWIGVDGKCPVKLETAFVVH